MFESTVLVKVKIDNLNEFSKSKKSTSKILFKIKRLRKLAMKIKSKLPNKIKVWN